jgi:hypothetical protein
MLSLDKKRLKSFLESLSGGEERLCSGEVARLVGSTSARGL